MKTVRLWGVEFPNRPITPEELLDLSVRVQKARQPPQTMREAIRRELDDEQAAEERGEAEKTAQAIFDGLGGLVEAMEKRNVAEPKRTPCSYCGRPSDRIVGDKAVCGIHVKLVKEGSAHLPLKDAGPSLAKEWDK